jgi:hypothetical protein
VTGSPPVSAQRIRAPRCDWTRCRTTAARAVTYRTTDVGGTARNWNALLCASHADCLRHPGAIRGLEVTVTRDRQIT